MKRKLTTIVMLLTLGMGLTATAQQPQKEQTELVDSASSGAGLEAYSDTTDVADSTVVSRQHRLGGYSSSGGSLITDIFGDSGMMEGLMGMTFVLAVVLIVFVISPLLILGLLLYFINRNRKQRLQMAQMAVQNGQPIPEQLLRESAAGGQGDADSTYQSGMRQLFLGIGLMVFLGYAAGKVGFGIGALVFFMGLGKVVIAKTNRNNGNNINNPQNNIQNYG